MKNRLKKFYIDNRDEIDTVCVIATLVMSAGLVAHYKGAAKAAEGMRPVGATTFCDDETGDLKLILVKMKNGASVPLREMPKE